MTFNDYIIANADRDANDDNFLRKFGQEEVFFSIDTPSPQLKDGPLTMTSNEALPQLPLAELDIGSVAVFYSSKNDPRLAERFAGMPLIRAALMACSIPEVEGLLIQSDKDAWIAVRKEALLQIVGQARA